MVPRLMQTRLMELEAVVERSSTRKAAVAYWCLSRPATLRFVLGVEFHGSIWQLPQARQNESGFESGPLPMLRRFSGFEAIARMSG